MKTSLVRSVALAAVIALGGAAFAHGGGPAFVGGRGGGGGGGFVAGGFSGGHAAYGGGHYGGGGYGYRPSFAFGGGGYAHYPYRYGGYYGGAAYYGGAYYAPGYVYYDSGDPGYDYDTGNNSASTYYAPDFEGNSNVVAQVQGALIRLGYYKGEATGSIGQNTRAAISHYQHDNNLTVTGSITGELLHALNMD